MDHVPATTGPAAVEWTGVVKRYGDTAALAGVDLRCPDAAVTALIGPNGAGKSTLFRSAAGLVRVDGGCVRVRGCPAGTRAAQRALSLMPEQPDLYAGVSVWEHLTFVALAYRLDGWVRGAETLLRRFDLTRCRDALPPSAVSAEGGGACSVSASGWRSSPRRSGSWPIPPVPAGAPPPPGGWSRPWPRCCWRCCC